MSGFQDVFLFLVEELEETVDLAVEEGEGERNCDSTTMATATVIVMTQTRWRLQHFHLGTTTREEATVQDAKVGRSYHLASW